MVNSKNEIILEMRNITKTFPGVKALDNVNLKVKKGEIHSLCGENGAGKSTLMKVLSGIYPYGDYDGEILHRGNLREKKLKDSEKDGNSYYSSRISIKSIFKHRRQYFFRE